MRPPARRRRRSIPGLGCCLPIVLLGCLLLPLLAVYFLAPGRTNILVMGIDHPLPKTKIARSDTLILTTFIPIAPYVGILSIPRDLWVNVPGVGENRINTAHFFAESAQAGTGPQAVLDTVEQNFGVNVGYYMRISFDGFREVVNALGGIEITLDQPMAGYEAGTHQLTGNKALAFARNRAGSDDFFRMEQGQIVVKSILKEMTRPVNWPRIPAVVLALRKNMDTNVPVWLWPRLGLAALRLGPGDIDNRTITREMATSTTTADGANVLLPHWELINPVLKEMFGQ